MGDHLTDAERALLALCDAATPGPWTLTKPGKDAYGFLRGVAIGGTYGRTTIYAEPPGGQYPLADAEFIAASRAALPKLLETINALREERDAYRALLERIVRGLTRPHEGPGDESLLQMLVDEQSNGLTSDSSDYLVESYRLQGDAFEAVADARAALERKP